MNTAVLVHQPILASHNEQMNADPHGVDGAPARRRDGAAAR